MRNKIDLAWAAGLFEGEGCFTDSTSGYRSLKAILNMTDRDVVKKFQSVVGFGAIYSVPPQKDGWKPQWRWQTGSFEEVQALVGFLWPWLCSRRRKKIKSILKKYHGEDSGRLAHARRRTEAVKLLLQSGEYTSQKAVARKFRISEARVTQIKKELQA